MKDVHLPAGLAIATVLAWVLILLRVIWWDSRKKRIWPLLDIISAVYFPILLVSDYVNKLKNLTIQLVADLTRFLSTV